jgi:hypothetical protein
MQVTFAKNVLPWLSIGGGILLVGVGIFLARRAGQAAPPPAAGVTEESQTK